MIDTLYCHDIKHIFEGLNICITFHLSHIRSIGRSRKIQNWSSFTDRLDIIYKFFPLLLYAVSTTNQLE